ncbi:MAG: carboxylating nicotinate-nucleotide diphosphorylase [bacterium]
MTGNRGERNFDELAREIVRAALREDIGAGDVTTSAVVDAGAVARGVIVMKERGVAAGLEVARLAFEELDAGALFEARVVDGDEVGPGVVMAEVRGLGAALLGAERTALNFLQRLSGVATLTREYVRELEGTGARIFDTRKTTPCLRALEKHAVRAGGGENHRMGLYDAVLVKENHARLVGGVGRAAALARERSGAWGRIEVEAGTLEEVREALGAGADVVLLDNMEFETMREAVALIGGRAEIEVSGGVTLENARVIAELGVQRISVGALTHSARAVDISMEIFPIEV